MGLSDIALDATEILINNAVQKAGYDKTIQAQIISCEDATIGKYRCRYQDSIFYAYANNSEMNFSKGSYVYVLVPGNDMSKEKTILGSTNKLGINYISQIEKDQAYETIGTNSINSKNIYYLDSNNINYKYKLYDTTTNNIGLDVIALEKYIKQSSSILVGAVFKTSIPAKRQARGHYGITYNLRFLDNTSNKDVIRSYTIDEDSMIGNPYRLIYNTRQYQVFNVDGANFKRLESIQIFNSQFPDATGQITNKKLTSGDIAISNLEICGAVKLSQNELGGVAITFYTPQGTFFAKGSGKDSTKTITAQVRVKGKLVSSEQKISFYWGSENVGITPKSVDYNKYLGRGWKCLNDKNVIQAATSTSDPVVEWVPGKDTYVVKISNATAKQNKFKVAIVYDGNVVTKQINIQNLNDAPTLTIESSGGTQFYYDIGHPTLTCKVNGKESSGYKYYWAYQSNTGVFEDLPETTSYNTDYQNKLKILNDLKIAIENGTKFANAQAQNLKSAENNVKAFNSIQRVKGNKIYDVQINNITSFGTFKCSVYNGNTYQGTASITLTNSLKGENLYSLVINNGSEVFQYNEDGIAPDSKSLDTPQQIQGLSFTIYDNLGNPLDDEIIANANNCKIRWEFPIKDTLLIDKNNGSSGTDATQTYKYYDNKTSLIYGITQKYDIKKVLNQIKLTVNYKGMNLTTETNFTFTKQGEPGTNGTQYIVKLIPNTTMNNPPQYPMITKVGNSYMLNYGLNSTASETNIGTTAKQLFKAQLWHSGELVWEGFSTDNNAKDGVTKPSLVHWEVLRNQYGSSKFDASAFVISNTNAGKGLIQYTGDHLASAIGTPLANIIKCSVTWQGKTYYGTIPIITAWVSNEKYRVNLKDQTGFRYVIYTSDGINPQYDDAHPFEFVCMQKINNVWEDISLINSKNISYTPSSCGNVLSTKDGTATNSNLLTHLNQAFYRDGLKKNQFRYRPASRYNGECVNEAVTCVYNIGNTIIGRINVPIHFLLNKYGLSNINAWDGNSVQVNSDGGYILSPQIGAGTKNSENQFTGVLMGEVKTSGKSSSDIGLLGYNKGDRTFFLNSQNGSAIFGKNNQGQIVIDPSKSGALLYSNNFWTEYNENGLPKNYNSSNENKKGLLIDLSKPEIRYGNGNFYVTTDGYIHASNGGDIAGWQVKTETLRSKSDKITLHSDGRIYSNDHNVIKNNSDGFCLSQNGLSIGSKVKITKDGKAYFGTGAVMGEGDNYWTINGDDKNGISYIAFGGDTAYNRADPEANNDAAKVYIGTDGISLGRRFSVGPKGGLYAYSGIIGGWNLGKETISAGSVKDANDKQHKTIILNADGSMSGGIEEYKTDKGDIVNRSWSISKTGIATFNHLNAKNSGNIAGWDIKKDRLTGGNIEINSQGSIKGGEENFKNTNGDIENRSWSISKTGIATFNTINANNAGSIAGWTIGSTKVNDKQIGRLKGGNLNLFSDGSIEGSNWSISASGDAHFNKIYGTVKNGQTLSGNGITVGGGKSGSTIGSGASLNPATVTYGGNDSLRNSGKWNTGSLGGGLGNAYETYFTSIYADKAEFNSLKTDVADIKKLNVMDEIKYNSTKAFWANIVSSVRLNKSGNVLTLYYTNRIALCGTRQSQEHKASQFSI